MRGNNFQATTLIAVAMLLLILFVSAGYMLLIPTADEQNYDSGAAAELQRNRELWERSRPASFRYIVDRSCFCGAEVTTPYRATEERGLKRAAFRTEIESSAGDFLAEPEQPLWIDDIFDQIAEAIASNMETTVDVRYDARYGYPLVADIRYPMPDAYFTYEIQDFEVLEYGQE